VVRAFGVSIQDGSILLDVRVTAVRFIIAFLIAISLGTPIGLLMGSMKRVYYALQFLVEFFRSIPTTALFPLFIT
jgi:NitT/TauT family transport system permease protein